MTAEQNQEQKVDLELRLFCQNTSYIDANIFAGQALTV